MLHSVIIDGCNLLDKYGLCLLADVTFPAPTPVEIRYKVPGMDGSLNMSSAITGRPVFEDIEIKFTVFARKEDSELMTIRSKLMVLYHGKDVKIIFPADTKHYYQGTLKIGEITGYNSGKIPMVLRAAPYKLRQKPSSVTAVVPESGTKELILHNEGMLAVPTITATAAAKITWHSRTYAIEANKPYRNLDIELEPDANVLQVAAAPGTCITAEYQEGSL